MTERLKKGWARVRFGDAVRQVQDRVDPENTDLERYVAGEHMDTDDLRIRRWGLIGNGYLGPAFHMRFKPGQVLYGSRRTYLRKVAVAEFEGVTANTTFVLESKDPRVLLPELLPFIMQTESFHEHSTKQSKGSVNPYINFSDLTWYEFALPPPDEQRRIAEVLSMVTCLHERLSCSIDHCDQVVASLRTSEFNPARHTPIPLGELCDENDGIQIGPFGAQLHQSDYQDAGIPVVMPVNMIDGRIVAEGIARVSAEKAQSLAVHRIQRGDILLPRRGELDRRAYVGGEAAGWLCGTGSVRVRVRSGVSSIAVFHALSSPHCVTWLNSNAVGTTMPNLNTGIVASIPVALPPASTLGAIVDALRSLDEVRNSLLQRRSGAWGVLRMILADSLAGLA